MKRMSRVLFTRNFLSLPFIAGLFFFTQLSSPVELLAGDHRQGRKPLKVKVRAVKAEGALPTWKRIHSDGVDKRIHDLYPKLESMPHHFERYSLLCERNAKLHQASKRVLKLSNGHHVALRPRVEGEDRVVSVRWSDEEGQVLLDTVMQFPIGSMSVPLVAGAPMKDSESGVILAIDMGGSS